jgi:hypothetical protein
LDGTVRIFRLAAILAAFICVSPWPPAASVAGDQVAEKQISYIFASPHTTARLSNEEAQSSQNSIEELNAISVADRIVCSFSRPAGISSTLGIFDGETEDSLVVEARLTRTQIDYAASLLGEYERQKFVLWFIPKNGGIDVLWTAHMPGGSSKEIAAVLKQLHVAGATIRRKPSATEIWIVDFGGKLGSGPQTLIATLRGSAQSERGVAALVGNDDRSKAAALFQKNIASFESANRARLSSQLRSPLWRGATSRTCSSEIPD